MPWDWLRRKVDATFVDSGVQAAYVSLGTLGWRQIKDGAPDGVTNVFTACCEARVTGHHVHVLADDLYVYTLYLT